MLLVRMALASLFAFTLVGLGNDLVRLWLRRSDIHFGLDIWSALAILLLSSTWVTAHTDLLTILDRIWIQVILVMFNGIATIVLTLVLSQVFGILGVIAAVGVVTVLGWTWVLPLISRSVLKSAAEKDLGGI